MLEVKPDGDAFRVVDSAGVLETLPLTKRDAWCYAATAEHRWNDAIGVVDPGGWFRSNSGKGWTSDPRFAITIKAEDATEGQWAAYRQAVARFVSAHCSTDPAGVFGSDMGIGDAESESESVWDAPESECP